MESHGKGIFYGVIGVATLIVAIIGATFAYFTASATATGDDITGGTNNDIASALSLEVDKVEFSGASAASTGLVPSDITADATSVGAALTAKCEADGYTGCHLYEIKATSTQTVTSASVNLDSLTVSPSVADAAIDTESWKYVIFTGSSSSVTSLVTDGNGSFDVSTAFDMHAGAGLTANTAVKYYLLIYIENDEDNAQNVAGESSVLGTYTGSVSLNAAGGQVSATFSSVS